MRAFVLYESRLKHWDHWLSQQFLGSISNNCFGKCASGISGKLATFKFLLAKKRLSGVLEVRETPRSNTSASKSLVGPCHRHI